MKYIPKKINLKYVKEVWIVVWLFSYDLEGLQSNHQILCDGEVNAQALVTWQELKQEWGRVEMTYKDIWLI